jgi:hypothetical protein
MARPERAGGYLERKVHDVTALFPTLIFDIGGVLIHHDNDLLYDRLAASCSNPTAARTHLPICLNDAEIGSGRLTPGAVSRARIPFLHGGSNAMPTYACFAAAGRLTPAQKVDPSR